MTEEELKKGNQFEGKETYVKDVFTEIADYYDEMNEIMSMHMVQGWHKFMMRKAGDISGKRCLDVGTGTGEIAFHVARKAGTEGKVVGVDITPGCWSSPPGRSPSWDCLRRSNGSSGMRWHWTSRTDPTTS